MKSRTQPRLTLAAVFFAAAVSGYAQTWQTILPHPDNHPLVTYGGGRSVLIQPPLVPGIGPRAYVGLVDYAGAPTLLRVTPADPTSPPSSVAVEALDGELSGGMNWVPRLAAVPGEGIYAAGRFTVKTKTSTDYFWKVRRSNPANPSAIGDPGTWVTEDIFIYNSKSAGSMANGITVDTQHNAVLVSGRADDGRGSRWIVRRRLVGAPSPSWATVLDVAAPDISRIEPPICFFPGNINNPRSAVLTAGQVQSGKFTPKWAVLRSQDGGVTWPDLQTWSPSGGGNEAYPVDLACDPRTGYIYAIGGVWYNGAAVPSAGWVVLVNRFGGDANKWETLIQDSAQRGSATSVAFDPAGNVSIAGWVDPTGTFPVIAVVRNSPGQLWSGSTSASWENRMFPFTDVNGSIHNSSVRGAAMTSDTIGNLYLACEVTDWTDGVNYYPGNRVALSRLIFP